MKYLNINEFSDYLDGLNIERQIDYVHIHHSYIPSYKDCYDSQEKHGSMIKPIEQIVKYHTRKSPFGRGWSEVGYHFMITPDGNIWIGRNINLNPCSSKGKNKKTGKYWNENALAICLIGNFDRDKDINTQNQIVSLKYMIRRLNEKSYNFKEDNIFYHNEMDNGKSCPGNAFYDKKNLISYFKNEMQFEELQKSNKYYNLKKESEKFIKELQKQINKTFEVSIAVDGIYGSNTHKYFKKLISSGVTSKIRKLLRIGGNK